MSSCKGRVSTTSKLRLLGIKSGINLICLTCRSLVNAQYVNKVLLCCPVFSREVLIMSIYSEMLSLK